MLNTHQIDKALSRNSATRRRFLGCFAADGIPAFSADADYPYGLVVNTDEARLPGEHWVAIWASSPSLVEYYDSLAEWPPQSPHISAYLLRFTHIRRNRVPLQSQLSSACGKHALYFILKRCQGRTYSAIVNHLRRRIKSTPDRVVHAAIRHHFTL